MSELEEARKEARDPERRLLNRLERWSYIPPIFPNVFDESSVHTGLAEMAGFGDRRKGGHDAMDGVDRMVTGEVDATAELRVESATEGGPLELDPFETIYSDDAGYGDLDPTLPVSDEDDPAAFDWTAAYRIEPEEML